jgi:hypothetical protein
MDFLEKLGARSHLILALEMNMQALLIFVLIHTKKLYL